MISTQIKVAGITEESIVDGEGIRYVIFTQGCPHRCEGCHNPQTHDFTKGKFASLQDIVAKVGANPMIKGITLSGGEPFMQAGLLIPLVKAVKKMGKDVWIYSGFTYEQLQQDITPHSSQLLEIVDVLVDGKFTLALRDLTLRFRGSINQRVIDCNGTRKLGRVLTKY